MKIICCFCADVRVTRCARLLHISKSALVDYYDNLRGEYSDQLGRDPIVFTPGHVYEVDEFQLKHVLDNDGNLYIPHLWIQSLFERETSLLLLFILPNRSETTLVGNILSTVPPGSIICTDEWPSYGSLSKEGYQHYTVNHSRGEYAKTVSLGEDELQVHINSLEGIHHGIRQRFAHKSSRRMARMELLLDEIMYRHSQRSLFYPFKA
jgi:ISXO2-like transposase domain